MTIRAAGLLFVSASVLAQQSDLQEQIRKTVDLRYADAPESHRALVAQRITALLGGRPETDRERIESVVRGFDQVLQYVRSFVHPYDLNAQGSTSFPPLPESMKSRQLDLELRWSETYIRSSLDAKTLAPGQPESITQQVDGLIHEVRNVLSRHVVGPFASEAIDANLNNMRHHLLGTFDQPVSANLPRALTSEEANDILDQVRKYAEGMKEPLEVNESLGSLRGGAGRGPAPDAEIQRQQDEQHKRYNEIVNTIANASKPLYDIFDLWDPDRSKITKELEKLRTEVQAWQREVSAESNRKAREKNEASGAGRASPPAVVKRPESPAAPTHVSPTPKPVVAPPAGDAARRPWGMIAWISLAALLSGCAIYWTARRKRDSI